MCIACIYADALMRPRQTEWTTHKPTPSRLLKHAESPHLLGHFLSSAAILLLGFCSRQYDELPLLVLAYLRCVSVRSATW